MRKNLQGIVAALAISATMGAAAQTSAVEKADGGLLNGNPNLHFVDVERYHVEVEARATTSFGTYSAYGAEASWRRVYTPASPVEYSYGITAGSEYSSEFGAANSASLFAGASVGGRFRVGLDIAGGYAQRHTVISSADAGEITAHQAKLTRWVPVLGSYLRVSYTGRKVVVSAFFGGTHAFASDGAYAPEEGWTVTSVHTDKDRLQVGIGLGLRLDPVLQRSGDNCWVGETTVGYGSRGYTAGLKAVHTKRTGYAVARTLGMGAEYQFGRVTTSELFGQAGLVILPSGAQSPIMFDLFVTAGIGQIEKAMTGAAADATRFQSETWLLSPAASGKGHFGVAYHAARFKAGIEGYAGALYGLVGTNFVNPDPEKDLGYHQTGETSRFAPVYGGNLVVAFNF